MSVAAPRAPAAAACAALLLAAAMLAGASAPPDGAVRAPGRIVVLASDRQDERVQLVEEAVAFWNRTAAELGFGAAFEEPEHTAGERNLRPFENYAHQLSQLAGRLHSSDPGPSPPPELLAMEADVVVLLSAQPLMPFAWPYDEDGSHFVAVPSGDGRRHVVRNVIAHELGHTLGLKHVREPGVLMCQPCDTSLVFRNGEPLFLPLTDLDRRRLRAFLGRTEP